MKSRASTDRAAAAAKSFEPERAGSKNAKRDLGLTARGTPRLIAPGSGRLDKNYVRRPMGMTQEAWDKLDKDRGTCPRGEWVQWILYGILPANGVPPSPSSPCGAPRPPAA